MSVTGGPCTGGFIIGTTRPTRLAVHPEEPVMVMFRNNQEITQTGKVFTAAIDEVWPEDSLGGIDDDAFAQAIAEGRKAEEADRITVAA